MNNSPGIIEIILASTLVSAVVSLLLKVIFENRQQHRFDMEIEKLRKSHELQLEKLKAQLLIETSLHQKITERRLEIYPKIVELIYRTRNLCREIYSGDTNPILASEFQSRTSEIENLLYTSRLDVERGGLFLKIHSYKNNLKAINRTLDEIRYLSEKERDIDEIKKLKTKLHMLYEKIENVYGTLVDEISKNIEK